MIDLAPIQLDASGLGAIRMLLNEVFPKARHFTAEYMDWMYRQNPSGEAIGVNAYDSGQLVGHVAAQRFSGTWGIDQAEEGVLIHNVCVRAQHQGKGIFGNMLRECLQMAARAGAGHMLAVPNAQSTPGFVRTLRCQAVTQLEARLGLGRLPEPTDRATGYRRFWTPDSSAWRLAWPGRTYWPKGKWTMGHTGWPGIQVGLDSQNSGGLSRPAAGKLFTLWIGWNPGLDWSGKLYFPIPQRFRPAPLNLVFLDLTRRGRQLSTEQLSFHGSDFDIY